MKRIVILVVALLLGLPVVGEAQIGVNLLKNPSVERYPAEPSRPTRDPDMDPQDWRELTQEEKEDILTRLYKTMLEELRPLDFYIRKGGGLNYTRTKDAHTGTYAISVYPNGDSFIPHGLSDYLPVVAGGTYEFSYWYKGDFPTDAILLSVQWYKGEGTGLVKTPAVSAQEQRVVKSPTEWKQKIIRFTAPDDVYFAQLGIFLQAKNESQAVLLDDFSFSLKELKKQQSSEQISELTATAEQREIYLKWKAIEGATYEVLVNDKVVATTSSPSYTLSGLEPQQTYNIQVRGVKDGSTTSPATKSVRTSALTATVNDPNRTPYLYSIREPYRGVAYAPERLPLYFRDLANKDAQITYWIDGVQTQPQGNVLVFPSTGKHRLKVKIVETTERIWTQYYKLDIE